MATKIIKAGWESYRSKVVPQDASEIQLKETEQAFFAGAAVLFTFLTRSIDDDPEPTSADMDLMQDIDDEIAEYGQELDRRAFGAGPLN